MTDQQSGFRDLDEFREANRRAGHHFFDANAMRFFRSLLPDKKMYAGRFFITSEQFEDSNGHRAPRRYTVRTARADGSIGNEIGAFQEWATLRDARAIAQAAAEGYLREQVKRHETEIAELRAEIARLEGGAS